MKFWSEKAVVAGRSASVAVPESWKFTFPSVGLIALMVKPWNAGPFCRLIGVGSAEPPFTVTETAAGTEAQVPSPLQNVLEEAEVPEFRCATLRFPATSFARLTAAQLAFPCHTVFAVAPVPLLRFVTGRFPPTPPAPPAHAKPICGMSPATRAQSAAVVARPQVPTTRWEVRLLAGEMVRAGVVVEVATEPVSHAGMDATEKLVTVPAPVGQ